MNTKGHTPGKVARWGFDSGVSDPEGEDGDPYARNPLSGRANCANCSPSPKVPFARA